MRVSQVADTLIPSAPPALPDGSSGQRSRLRWPADGPEWVTLGVAVACVVATFWYINRYALNILYFDQFTNVVLIHRARTGTLTWSDLWAQHNENRVLFPNFVVLLLGWADHLNVVVEDWINGLLACLAAGLVVLTHKRWSPSIPWILYCPVIVLLASFYPLSNALFGFNLTWYMALAATAGALYVLDRPQVTGRALALAIVIAVVASYSSLQGLLVWPAGIALLYFRGRSLRLQGAWALAMVVTTAVFVWGFDFAGSTTASTLGIGSKVLWFLAEVANVTGGPQSSSTTYIPGAMVAVGAAVLVITGVAFAFGLRRGQMDGAAVGLALVVFGLVFVASAVEGRIGLGLSTADRYSIFVLTIWVGTYLGLLTFRDRQVAGTGRGWRGLARWIVASPSPGAGTVDEDRRSGQVRRAVDWAVRPVLVVAVLVLVIQATNSMSAGLTQGRGWRTLELNAANMAANIDEAPDATLPYRLGLYLKAPYVRRAVAMAKADQLSLFDSPLAAEEARKGLDPAVLATIFKPESGALVKGPTALAVGVVYQGVTSVQFEMSGLGGRSARVTQIIDAASGYGWVATWETHSVPNGFYRIRALIHLSTGQVKTAGPIVVKVANKWVKG